MLVAEAIIAEVIVTLFVCYSCVKRIGGGEGVGVATVITAAVLFVAIPLTYHFMG